MLLNFNALEIQLSCLQQSLGHFNKTKEIIPCASHNSHLHIHFYQVHLRALAMQKYIQSGAHRDRYTSNQENKVK